MTVFKGFMILVKRNLGMFFLFLAIFVTLCVSIQVLSGEKGNYQFQEESLNIAIIDRDGSTLSEGLTDYLGERNHLVDVPDEKGVIQEKLFYRDIYYVVIIPEDFERVCLEEGEKLATTKISGADTSLYIDQQIDAFLNEMRILKNAGFSTEEALREVQEIGSRDGEVVMIDKNGHGGSMALYAYLFRYLPYLLLSVLCYIIGFVMIAYRKEEVRRRILCSSLSLRRQNMQLVAGFVVIGAVFWGICMALPLFMYGKDFLADENLPYYLLNSFVMMLVALSISFVIGVLVEKEVVVNGVVNVVSLGMSFICGVFVPASILGKGVRTVSHFLPVYWYETVNEIIGNHVPVTASQRAAVWQGMGIQLLFATAILSLGLVASKYKEQR